ncbi:hypothetical protein ABID14_000199 [Peptoniphilus olsenii]|uniref:Uncharacterized protein n=1 Tax=Peptoniphilus olsenii TaxID=411570 RepID=A0ABV2J9X6_9FIRM
MPNYIWRKFWKDSNYRTEKSWGPEQTITLYTANINPRVDVSWPFDDTSKYQVVSVDFLGHESRKRDGEWENNAVNKVTYRVATTERVFSHYSKGSYIEDVKSTSRNAYPNNNYSGSYWYVYKGVDNQAPTISGSNLNLGSKTEDFDIEYIVSDADSDKCTVSITVDNVKKVTDKSVTLNAKYTYKIKISDFTLGKHNIKITAKDSKGATSSTRTYTFTKSNTAPTIDGQDSDLGGKSTAFTKEYRVTDKNNDDVKVTVILNDTEIATVSSAQDKDLSFTITDEHLKNFEIGSTHTITIKADDGKGGVAYRRYTFTKINRPPIISDSDGDLGAKKDTFTQKFSLTDVEKDKIYCRVYLDNKKIYENLEVEDSKEYSYSIPHDDFLKLKYGKHTIKVEAWDDFSVDNKQYRVYTFERVSNGLEVEIKINEFDVKPGKVIAVPHGIFASDAVITVKACNNYNDTKPTWEDMSTESKAARAYAFKNSTKTADKWAIGIKIIAENGESDVSSVLRGVKGGYE